MRNLLLCLTVGLFVYPILCVPCGAQESAREQPVIDPDHVAKMKEGLELFQTEVRGVLTGRCIICHGGSSIEADFDLSTRESLLAGGYSGKAIEPGEPDASLLMDRIRHDVEPGMPIDGAQLPEHAIAAIARWIELGAPYDQPLVEQTDDPLAWTERTVDPSAGRFWSFEPLAEATPPAVDSEDWVRNDIDRFISARLEDEGLAPNEEASRRQLIRRASLDLIGLPPTAEEIDAFVQDDDPLAYEKLIDRLLKSPHYGERWGRHWLDIARFAESHGFEQDYDRPHAYHYRDFVIRALNDDMPYDQFVRWQIAGDEIAPDDPLAMMATGFLGAGVFPTQLTEREFEPARYDEMDDMLGTLGTAMLGLTVACARCHDHKFDPIPASDYHRMLATFTSTIRSNVELDLEPERTRQAWAQWEAQHQPLADALQQYEQTELPVRFKAWWTEKQEQGSNGFMADADSIVLDQVPASSDGSVEGTELLPLSQLELAQLLNYDLAELSETDRRRAEQRFRHSDERWQTLHRAVQKHLAEQPQPELTKVMVTSEGVPPIAHHADGRGFPHFYEETYFLNRGDIGQKHGQAKQGFLQVLTRAESDSAWPVEPWQVARPEGAGTSYRRYALANWITDTEYGAGHLLARVIVNRLWQHHFGRGIVATPNDFGYQGMRPTHPELLDYLAGQLIQNGWRLKPLHRQIMSSAAYRQASTFNSQAAAVDPDNELLWRFAPRRMEAEIIRDSILAVGGQLDRRMFGPGTLDEAMKRRSIYFMIKRSELIPMMQIFDAPEPLVGVAQRPATTIAPQSLFFMNSPVVRQAAGGLARQVLEQTAESPSWEPAAVERIYLAALGRVPDERERARALEFLEQQGRSYRQEEQPAAAELALTDFCQAVFSLNEFVFID